MATENVRVVKIDTNAAQTSVKELRQQLKELKDTMLSCEKGTEEYNAALTQAANISHTLKEQTEELNASAMDFGQITGNLVKATGGLVAGFQAAKASMKLMGLENEDVLKSLEKMQNLMSITQALPSIDNGVKAFKRLGLAIKGAMAGMNGLKAALISTGIGAAVVAIGLLAANWDKLTASMNKWKIESEETKKKLEEQRKKLEELQDALKKAKQAYDDWEKADTISRLNKKAKEEYDFLANLIDGYTLKAKALQAELDAINANNNASIDDEDRWLEVDEELARVEGKLKAVTKLRDDLLNNPLNFIETLSPDDVINDEWAVKWRKKIEDGLFADKKDKAIKVPVTFVEPEDEDVSQADALRDKIKNTIQSLRDAFITPEEQYQQEINALELWKNVELNKFKDNEEKKYEILQEYYKLRDALNKEQTQREIQRYALAANSIGAIFTSLGETLEEGTEEQKALQIMGATINMLGGITAAIAGAFTTHSGPWDIALAVIQAAAIAASGGATIAKMAQTNKNNATSLSHTSVSTGAINNIIAPVQYTQDVQGASIEGAIKDTKVYVTETDITNTQNKVSVTENEARF